LPSGWITFCPVLHGKPVALDPLPTSSARCPLPVALLFFPLKRCPLAANRGGEKRTARRQSSHAIVVWPTTAAMRGLFLNGTVGVPTEQENRGTKTGCRCCLTGVTSGPSSVCVIREVSAILSEVLRCYGKRFVRWVASARELLRARELRAVVLPPRNFRCLSRDNESRLVDRYLESRSVILCY
jgi:hypothetical protein